MSLPPSIVETLVIDDPWEAWPSYPAFPPQPPPRVDDDMRVRSTGRTFPANRARLAQSSSKLCELLASLSPDDDVLDLPYDDTTVAWILRWGNCMPLFVEIRSQDPRLRLDSLIQAAAEYGFTCALDRLRAELVEELFTDTFCIAAYSIAKCYGLAKEADAALEALVPVAELHLDDAVNKRLFDRLPRCDHEEFYHARKARREMAKARLERWFLEHVEQDLCPHCVERDGIAVPRLWRVWLRRALEEVGHSPVSNIVCADIFLEDCIMQAACLACARKYVDRTAVVLFARLREHLDSTPMNNVNMSTPNSYHKASRNAGTVGRSGLRMTISSDWGLRVACLDVRKL